VGMVRWHWAVRLDSRVGRCEVVVGGSSHERESEVLAAK
jgi:hypothetical protein